MTQQRSVAMIQVRAERINQLFDTLDPTPYPKKDLAQTTETFIVGWARELSSRQPIGIVVYLPKAEAESAAGQQLGDAFTSYFQYRADRFGLDRKELFRVGGWSLLIGLSVLALCLIVGQVVTARFETSYLARLARESLIILGWVANWRPIEIFLYDWLPLERQRRLYRRLSEARIEVRPLAEPIAI